MRGCRNQDSDFLINLTVSLIIQYQNFEQDNKLCLACGGEIKSARVINSPPMNIEKTPGLYHGYLNCVWNITAPPKKMIVVNFQEFNFDYRRNCYFDNVEIYEGSAVLRSKRIANLCGNLNKNLPSIKSENNTVLIVLKADRTANHAGFKAEVYFADGM